MIRDIYTCMAAGVAPTFVQWVGYDERDLLTFVMSKNRLRRHLEKGQWACIAAVEAKFRSAKAIERKLQNLKNRKANDGPTLAPFGRTAEVLEKEYPVGKTSIKEAMRLEKADPERFEKVKTGEEPLWRGAKSKTEQAAKSAAKKSIHTTRENSQDGGGARTQVAKLIEWLEEFKFADARRELNAAGAAEKREVLERLQPLSERIQELVLQLGGGVGSADEGPRYDDADSQVGGD